MKIIRDPSVHIVGRQSVDLDGIVRFLDGHDIMWNHSDPRAGHVLPEIAGRLCYMSFKQPRPGGNEAYLRHIIEASHGSVLEHAVWNFIITGVSRSLTHELVRHRIGLSYSMLSQRYVDESVAEYVVPPAVANSSDPALLAEWTASVQAEHDAYVRLSERLTALFADEPDATARRKRAREAARSLLPNATETKIFVTANARALRHFVEMRGSRHADAEIRRLANLLLRVMNNEAPHLFGDYEWERLPDGTWETTTKNRKV